MNQRSERSRRCALPRNLIAAPRVGLHGSNGSEIPLPFFTVHAEKKSRQGSDSAIQQHRFAEGRREEIEAVVLHAMLCMSPGIYIEMQTVNWPD